MSRLITLLLALTVCTSVSLAALAPTPAVSRAASAQDAPKQETERQRLERKARKVLEQNGTKEIQKRALDKMMDAFKGVQLPNGFAEKFKSSFDIDHVIDMAVKIYADKLDEATLDALVAFYDSPGGKSFAAAMPEIQEEMLTVGMKYGQELAQDVLRELGK